MLSGLGTGVLSSAISSLGRWMQYVVVNTVTMRVFPQSPESQWIIQEKY